MEKEMYKTLFQPRVINIDEPGRIISAVSDYYGKPFQRKRMIYVFEAPFTRLMTDTMEKLGKKKAEDLFYRIGKDIAYRYMIIAQAKKATGETLQASLKAIFSNLRKFGFTIGENLEYNEKDKTLRLRGKDNIFCSKSGEAGFTAGVVSGFFSFLSGENIEAEKVSCSYESNFCEVVARPEIKTKYEPRPNELRPSAQYDQRNFEVPAKPPSGFPNFDELIAFKKVAITGDGKIMMKDQQITILEIGCFGLISHNFHKRGKSALLRKSLLKSNNEVMKKICDESPGIEKKMSELKHVLSAFGWGIVESSIKGKSLSLNIEDFPWCRYAPDYLLYSINGMLNCIFEKEMEIKEMKAQGSDMFLSFT